MSANPPVGRAGNIYDLGYRRYEGPRLGRAHAIRSLIVHSFRTTYGIGRSGRAKAAPIIFGAMAILPAVIIVGGLTIAARFGFDRQLDDAELIGFNNYYSSVTAIIVLFCAAQAPELFGRDQRYGVLPLYFSRVLTRSDYGLAKVFALMAALLAVELSPYVVLFVGRVLVAPDPVTGLSDEIDAVPRFVLQAVLVSGLLGGLAALIAAWTPRRAYATAAIIAVFIIPPIIAAILGGSSLSNQDITRIAVLLSPGDILDGTNAAIFGSIPDSPVVAALDQPGWVYLAAAVVGIVGSIGLTVRRYLRISA